MAVNNHMRAKMKRREFLKTSLTATALGGTLSTSLPSALGAESGAAGREYYEWRVYRLKSGSSHELLDSYLQKAAIPALNRLGIKSVGVFTEKEPKDGPAVNVLIPYPSLSAFGEVTARLSSDSEYQTAGAEYLGLPKTNPAFERIDNWFLLAFAGLPKMELPAYCREKKPRLFEVRTYESYSEAKALKKVEMFNAGEIDTMREVGLGPIFFGQALVGKDLPHLTYMLSAEDEDAHKTHWGGFGKHPVWQKLQKDPQYADTVSKIVNRFLTPTVYSQI
jgi:hypothetical protein